MAKKAAQTAAQPAGANGADVKTGNTDPNAAAEMSVGAVAAAKAAMTAAQPEDSTEIDDDDESATFNLTHPPKPAAPKVAPVISLPERLMRSGEHVNNVWSVTAPTGTPWEHVFDPTFWSNVARLFKTGDRVQVHAEDGLWFGELYVRAASGPSSATGHWAKMGELLFKRFAEPVQQTKRPSAHHAEFRGPIRKWCVIRNKDNQIVKEGLHLVEDAERWIRDTEVTLGRS